MKFRQTILVVTLLLFGTSLTHADITTQLATVNNGLAGGIPAIVPNVSSIQDAGNLGGSSFVNQYTSFGVPSASGDRVRTVGAVQITGYNTTAGFQPFTSLTSKVTAVFALDAPVSLPMGTPAITLEQTRLNFYASPSATLFNNANPATWGTDGTLLASFTLKPQEAITGPGTAGAQGLNIPAEDVNFFAANLAIGSSIDGFAIFRDLVDPFIDVDGVPPAIPVPGFQFLESLIAVVDETIVDPATRPISAADLGLLNAIALALGMPADIGGFAFANGLGGMDPLNFTPQIPAGPVTGDFTTSLGLNFVPGSQQEVVPNGPDVVPEPSSILVWSLIIGCFGAVSGLRHRGQHR